MGLTEEIKDELLQGWQEWAEDGVTLAVTTGAEAAFRLHEWATETCPSYTKFLDFVWGPVEGEAQA